MSVSKGIVDVTREIARAFVVKYVRRETSTRPLGYLSALSRPEQVVHFVRKVVGVPVVSKEILSQRTADYQNRVEAYARNHHTPIEWAEKGVRKEDHVRPWLRRMANKNAYGVYFIFKSMEQGPTFRISVPKYPTQDPHHRILARQRICTTAQRLLRQPARLQESRKVAAFARLRNAQLHGASARLPQPVAVAIRLGKSLGALLPVAGTGLALNLQLHQALR